MFEQGGNLGERATNILIYFDYLCPWCYIAFVRLQTLKEEYGESITFTWKSFPLKLYGVESSSPSRLNWAIARATEEEKSIRFKPWPESLPLPSSSMPALEASKCAQLQGREAFERYHLLLFKSYFEQSKDISHREVLHSIAREAKLDYNRFELDFSSKKLRDKVRDEYKEAREEYNIIGIPTVLFENGGRLECAVPVELYKRVAKLCLGK